MDEVNGILRNRNVLTKWKKKKKNSKRSKTVLDKTFENF